MTPESAPGPVPDPAQKFTNVLFSSVSEYFELWFPPNNFREGTAGGDGGGGIYHRFRIRPYATVPRVPGGRSSDLPRSAVFGYFDLRFSCFNYWDVV